MELKEISPTPYYSKIEPASCSPEAFDKFLSLGWYSLGQNLFTTSHVQLEESQPPLRVHWLRYRVQSVCEKSSHRRIRRKNSSFKADLADPFVHDERLDSLYAKYFDHIDFDGYANLSEATFNPGGKNIFNTKAIIIKSGNKIIACGIFHTGINSLASVIHFYDPECSSCSPGKYLILKTLDYCRDNNIEWYYPGYLMEGNPKMDYKLFLGKDVAQYYSPEPVPWNGTWLPYHIE